MAKNFVMVDPPEGHFHGFPKACPREVAGDEKKFGKWLIENGYPNSNPPYIRMWEANDE
jgi:hypothetical protein